MDMWIALLSTPCVAAVMTWYFGRKSRRIDDISKLVLLLQTEISRMSEKMVKMEAKMEAKEKELEMKNIIIQECWACKTPSAKCPPLKMQALFNRQKVPSNEITTNTDGGDADSGVRALQDANDEPIDRPP